MKKLRTYIQRIFIKFYYRTFPVHEFFGNHKSTIAHIIKRYKAVDYEKQVVVEETMGEYTRGLLALLMVTKTFNFIFVTYLKNFVHPEIQETIDNAEEIQKSLLAYLIDTTKTTVFGEKHGFNIFSEQTYEDFVNNVPVVHYDQYKEWIERAKREPDIIRPGKINKFSASAGTTSRKKHIPVTDELLESISKA